MSKNLPHDSVIPYKNSDKSKKEQVADMFDNIAGKYDFMNRFLSARIDLIWRKKAIKKLKKSNPQLILDVATGTGDMALLTYKKLNPQKIIGIDISVEMLNVGKKKIEKEGLSDKIELQKGDSETINFPDSTFDAVMAAFGVRNFEHLEQGLSEMRRVMKPGGQLMIIEFSTPRNKAFKKVYNWYMRLIAPKIAKTVTQNQEAYEYLTASSNAFPDRENFTSILEKVGFKQTQYKSLTGGICCIYEAKK